MVVEGPAASSGNRLFHPVLRSASLRPAAVSLDLARWAQPALAPERRIPIRLRRPNRAKRADSEIGAPLNLA